MPKYGSVLRDAREAAGKTQREVGDAIGKTFGYVSEVEIGKRGPFEVPDNARIARLLGIPEVRLQVPAAVERREISLRGLTPAGIARVVEVVLEERERAREERAARKGRGVVADGAIADGGGST